MRPIRSWTVAWLPWATVWEVSRALELARSGAALAAVASIHGSLHTAQPAEPGVVRARLLVCHGALDPHVPMTQVQEFVEEMNRAGADWELHVYGGAMHGFTHDQAGPPTPGVAYHAAADARSSAALSAMLTDAFASTTSSREQGDRPG